ncbi:MAG: hypothetical protein IPO24_00335 [Bacteroidetes bacterium]|nr:hypothetical protein [Bacteroidota bacterium]
MKLIKLSAAVLLLGFLATGCQKTIDIVEQTPIVQSAPEYKLLTPAYYRESADGSSIQVRFYQSPRIYDLPKSHENYNDIKNMIDNSRDAKSPLRVFIGTQLTPFVQLTGTEPASPQEILEAEQKYELTPESNIYKKFVPSMTALNTIFDFCADQGCATGTATIDYCIPFQYVVDGCYARAHKMRQIMLENYNVSCEKVFSYEDVTGFLAVDAGDCCVYWWYHVAPLVTVKSAGGGYTKWVVDPSMFNEPVSIATWTGAQENTSCSPAANWGYYEITPGNIYGPGGSTDNSYISTNWTLQAYANLETCD